MGADGFSRWGGVVFISEWVSPQVRSEMLFLCLPCFPYVFVWFPMSFLCCLMFPMLSNVVLWFPLFSSCFLICFPIHFGGGAQIAPKADLWAEHGWN